MGSALSETGACGASPLMEFACGACPLMELAGFLFQTAEDLGDCQQSVGVNPAALRLQALGRLFLLALLSVSRGDCWQDAVPQAPLLVAARAVPHSVPAASSCGRTNPPHLGSSPVAGFMGASRL